MHMFPLGLPKTLHLHSAPAALHTSPASNQHEPMRRYQHVFILDKLSYNALHPYTSWMPILCWIVVRLCHRLALPVHWLI